MSASSDAMDTATYEAIKPTDCIWWVMGRHFEHACQQCLAAQERDKRRMAMGEVLPIGCA